MCYLGSISSLREDDGHEVRLPFARLEVGQRAKLGLVEGRSIQPDLVSLEEGYVPAISRLLLVDRHVVALWDGKFFVRLNHSRTALALLECKIPLPHMTQKNTQGQHAPCVFLLVSDRRLN